MVANSDDFAYFGRGEHLPYVIGKAATTGFGYLNRGEVYQAALLLQATPNTPITASDSATLTETIVLTIALVATDSATLGDSTETLDEVTLLTDLLEVILSSSRTVTHTDILAILSEVAAALTTAIADSDSATLAESQVVDVTSVAPAVATPVVQQNAFVGFNLERRKTKPYEFVTTFTWSVWGSVESSHSLWWRVLEPVLTKSVAGLSWECFVLSTWEIPVDYGNTRILKWDALEPVGVSHPVPWSVWAPLVKSTQVVDWRTHTDLEDLIALGVI